MKRDTLYKQPICKVKDFIFDEQVAAAFDDMIERSVPHYAEIQHATAEIAQKLYQPDTCIYDLGCSTGTTLLHLSQAIHDPTVRFIGVDNSRAMLDICEKKVTGDARIGLVQADIQETDFNNPSVIILNYSLQFLEPTSRPMLLASIYQSLPREGVLVVTEKIRNADRSLETLSADLYYDFKRRNGYSELEISQKREALEDILIPLTIEENLAQLQLAGFSKVDCLLKWYNFASFVAIK